MGRYVLRRLLLIVPTLVGIMVVNFTIVQFAPGGPVEQVIAEVSGMSASLIHSLGSPMCPSVRIGWNNRLGLPIPPKMDEFAVSPRTGDGSAEAIKMNLALSQGPPRNPPRNPSSRQFCPCRHSGRHSIIRRPNGADMVSALSKCWW